jgi:hypothetical protein
MFREPGGASCRDFSNSTVSMGQIEGSDVEESLYRMIALISMISFENAAVPTRGSRSSTLSASGVRTKTGEIFTVMGIFRDGIGDERLGVVHAVMFWTARNCAGTSAVRVAWLLNTHERELQSPGRKPCGNRSRPC